MVNPENLATKIQEILQNDFEGKTILDVGCGGGKLSTLLGKKLGAQVKGIDTKTYPIEKGFEFEETSFENYKGPEPDLLLFMNSYYAVEPTEKQLKRYPKATILIIQNEKRDPTGRIEAQFSINNHTCKRDTFTTTVTVRDSDILQSMPSSLTQEEKWTQLELLGDLEPIISGGNTTWTKITTTTGILLIHPKKTIPRWLKNLGRNLLGDSILNLIGKLKT